MAMTMTGEVTLPAPREKVWEALNDPEVLKACIPGCQSLEVSGENAFAATVKLKVGPVSATFAPPFAKPAMPPCPSPLIV